MRLLILIVALFTLFASDARALTCDDEETKVTLDTILKPTQYIRTSSSRNLTEMHAVRGDDDKQILGLGGGEMQLRGKTEFTVTTQWKKACVSLKAVTLTFYARPQIHIASNFKKGSCHYASVLEHEQKHAKALKNFHREYGQELRKELQKYANKIKVKGPVSKGKATDIQQKMSDLLSEMISRQSDEMADILEERQVAIDTPEEYKRVAAKCKKWDQDLEEE